MMDPLLPPPVELRTPLAIPEVLLDEGRQPQEAQQAAPPEAPPGAPPRARPPGDPLLQQAVTALSDYSVERLSSQLFCDDQIPEAKIRSHTRRQEALQATHASKARVKRFSSLPQARLPEAIQNEATQLASRVQALPVEKSLVFAGSYGKKRSITQEFLKLGRLALDKNPQGLPPLLFKAFKKGTPTEEEVLQALFAIVAEKQDQWTSDPCAQCILNLILSANPSSGELAVRLDLLINKVNTIQRDPALPGSNLLARFNDTHPKIIPNNYGRDKLLEALVPAENSALAALFALVLPPKVAADFAANPPQTIEEIIDPLLKTVFDHLSQQLPDQQGEVVAASLDKLVKQWSPSVRLTKILGKKAGSATLYQRWQTLKDKRGQALLDELKNLALEVSGEPVTGFSHFLRNYIDTEIETLLEEHLHGLPANVTKLLQDAVLSPTGEYFVKCIRTGSNAFDVEVYASGPLMHLSDFEGKWPLTFKNLKAADLNDAFFVGLIQHTLALEESSSFSSSPEHFKQFLLELGKPSSDAPALSYLPKSYLTSAEMLFHYIAQDSEVPSITQNPAAKRLLWQHTKLQYIMQRHLQNGLLDTKAKSHVHMLKRACRQLSASAENISRRFPKEFEKSSKEIKTTCESAEKICDATIKARKPEGPFHLPTSLKARLQDPLETLAKIVHIVTRRILPNMPYARSSVQIGYQFLLYRLFKLREDEASNIYEMLRSELAIQNIGVELTARQETLIKLLEASHAAFRAISFVFNKLCGLLNIAVTYLLTRLPDYARRHIQHIGAVLHRDLSNMAVQMQRKMIQLMVDFMIARYCDQTLLNGFALVKNILNICMRTNPDLAFEVPRGMDNGEYMAIEFKEQLLPLLGFTSLDHVKVVVEGGAVTAIKFTKILDNNRELIFSRRRDNSFAHPDYGTVCPKQHRPQLAAFGSYLLVYDEASGEDYVLVRETLVSNQLVDFFGESENGSLLWNVAKLFIPQSNPAGALHVCHFPRRDRNNPLPDNHLTASTPEALLYIMRSYLACENDKAALAAFEDWKKLLESHPAASLPDLTPHLLPFLFCRTETAVKIRLSLFATLAKSLRQEGSSCKPHPLHNFLWLVLSADLKALTPADFQTHPALSDQAPLLREMALEAIKELPRFYTTTEFTEGAKQLLCLKGEASGDNLRTLFARAAPVIPYIEGIAKRNLLQQLTDVKPPSALTRVVKNSYVRAVGGTVITGVALVSIPTWGMLAAGASGLGVLAGIKYLPDLAIKKTIKNLPNIAAELLEHTQLSHEDRAALRTFFMSNTARRLSSECEIDPHFQPLLTAETLKTRFWSYYRLFYDDSQTHNQATRALKRPLLLLQQNLGSDREAAVLARILGQLLWLIQENKGASLKNFVDGNPDAFSAISLQTLLYQEGQGIDALIQRIKILMTEPHLILTDKSTRRKILKTTAIKSFSAVTRTLAALTYVSNKKQTLIDTATAKKNALVDAVTKTQVKARQTTARGVYTIIRKGVALQNTLEQQKSALMQEGLRLQNAFCFCYPLDGPNIDQIQQVAGAIMCLHYLTYSVAVSPNRYIPRAPVEPYEHIQQDAPPSITYTPNKWQELTAAAAAKKNALVGAVSKMYQRVKQGLAAQGATVMPQDTPLENGLQRCSNGSDVEQIQQVANAVMCFYYISYVVPNEVAPVSNGPIVTEVD